MKTIKIELSSNVDMEEFVKVIGFISESILDYKTENNMVIADIEDKADEEHISMAVKNLAAKYVSARLIEKNIYQNRKEIDHYYNEFKSIYYFDEGMASLSGVSLFLFRYFENYFESKMKEIFEIPLEGEYIKLGQALKAVNIAEDGVDAKYMIQDGLVQVNGEIDTRRGRKLCAGDVVDFQEVQIRIVR